MLKFAESLPAEVTSPAQITHRHSQAFLASLRRDAEGTNSTAVTRYIALGVFFKWAVRDGVIEVNPMDRVDRPASRNTRTEIPELEEIKALVGTCNGGRTDFLAVHHPYVSSPMPWLGGQGKPAIDAEAIWRIIARRARQAGVRMHPHMFRHYAADAHLAAGYPEGAVMHMTGWSDRWMLDRYGAANARTPRPGRTTRGSPRLPALTVPEEVGCRLPTRVRTRVQRPVESRPDPPDGGCGVFVHFRSAWPRCYFL